MQRLKDFIYYNRKELVILFVCIIIFMCYIFMNDNKDYKSNDIVKEEIEKEKLNEDFLEKIVVDIKGEVVKPGIYEMAVGKRIIDVINESGGLTSIADTSNINLSEKISDEMLIIIPSKDEVKQGLTNNNTISLKEHHDGKISINTATVEDFMKIKGLGEVKSKSIIEYRNQNGRFKSIEEITNVTGIGNSTFEKIKNYIKV